MKNNKNTSYTTARHKSVRTLACSALFVALSIVCGKYLAIPFGNILRFSFENLPIILTGVLFGPLAAALVGALADILGCVLVGYTINPLITAGAVAIGLTSGGIYRIMKKAPVGLKLTLSVAVSHIVGSVIIKTFGLAAWYDMPILELMLWRLLNYAIVGTLEIIILYAILKVGAISDILQD